jgi:hypothetical protein
MPIAAAISIPFVGDAVAYVDPRRTAFVAVGVLGVGSDLLRVAVVRVRHRAESKT